METYYYTRIALLRYVGFVMVCVFATSFFQNESLIGKSGLLPGPLHLDRIASHHASALPRNEETVAGGGKKSSLFEISDWCAVSKSYIESSSSSWKSLVENLFWKGLLPKQLRFIGFDKFLDSTSCFLSRKLLSRRRDPKIRGGLTSWQAVREAPTILWWVPVADFDSVLTGMAACGLGISVFICVTGCANSIMFVLLLIFQHSISSIGSQFYSFGWESQLCELLFIMVVCVPLVKLERYPDFELQTIPRWLLRLHVWRVVFGAGLIKIKGYDDCWKSFDNVKNCMMFHYETQPVPSHTSIFFKSLPPFQHLLELCVNHFAELVAPQLLLVPNLFSFSFSSSSSLSSSSSSIVSVVNMFGAAVIVIFMWLINLTGNLIFLNHLTAAPCFACFSDQFWISFFSNYPPFSLLFPRSFLAGAIEQNVQEKLQQPQKRTNNAKPGGFFSLLNSVFSLISLVIRLFLQISLLLITLSFSYYVLDNYASPRTRMNEGYHFSRIVNSHGNFGSITKTREEVFFFGEKTKNREDWLEYEFPCKITRQADKIVEKQNLCTMFGTYHYRITWLLWFSGFAGIQNAHFYHLSYKMLENDKKILSELLTHNPFNSSSAPARVKITRQRFVYRVLKPQHGVDLRPMMDVVFRKSPDFLRPIVHSVFEFCFPGEADEILHRKANRENKGDWVAVGKEEVLLPPTPKQQLDQVVSQQILQNPLL